MEVILDLEGLPEDKAIEFKEEVKLMLMKLRQEHGLFVATLTKELLEWGNEMAHALLHLGFSYTSNIKGYDLYVYDNDRYSAYIPYSLENTLFMCRADFYIRVKIKASSCTLTTAHTADELRMIVTAPETVHWKTNKYL